MPQYAAVFPSATLVGPLIWTPVNFGGQKHWPVKPGSSNVTPPPTSILQSALWTLIPPITRLESRKNQSVPTFSSNTARIAEAGGQAPPTGIEIAPLALNVPPPKLSMSPI